MPTYFARGVSVRLSATPLEDSTTQKIILRKGDAAKNQSESAGRRLLKRHLLKEKVVPFPGDEDAFHLNWVANAPFMQTRVRNDVYDEKEATTDAASNRRPKALALHVNLSDKTYVSGLYNQKTSLKVEVFFNGILSACLFIPTHDVKSGVKSNHQVFAGTRIDFLAERPWVVLSPEVAADGSARKGKTTASVEQRWQNLCHVLQTEARERGTNEEGNRPPTARFLCALAKMQMPEQVCGMHKPGGKTFGVIDVVVTAGDGRKLTSGVGYLKAPKRMADESYPFVLDTDDTTMRLRTDASGESESEGEPQNAIELSSKAIDVDAEGDSDPDYDSHTKRQALRTRVRLTQDVAPVLSSALQHPAIGLLVPSIPPPVQLELRSTVLQAPEMTGPDFASSPGFRRVQASALKENRVYGQQKDVMSQAGFIPKMVYPDLPPNLQTPQIRPSPYAIQFSDPTLGGIAPSDLMRQIRFDNSGLSSSPLDRFPLDFQGAGYPTASSFPLPMPGLQPGPSRLGPYAYPSPDQPRSDFLDTHYSRPNYSLSGVGPPLARAPELYKPNMLPHGPALPELQKARPPQMPFPPFDRLLSLPLPPAALYSVPTKPKRSLSPQKASSSQQLKKAKSSVEFKRLVIHGQKDSILVDHRWDPAPRIVVSLDSPARLQTPGAVASDDKKHANPVEQGRTFTDIRGTRKSPVRMDTSAPISAPEHEKTDPFIATDKQQQTSSCQADVLTDQHSSTAKQSNTIHKSEKVEKAKLDSNQPDTDTSNQNLCVIKEKSSHCTASGNSMIGVQGLKANPFWFEDPEGILREASGRLRRSRPSEKQGDASDVAVPPKTAVPAVQTPKAWEIGTSSPLSSLHTTPEPDMEPASYTRFPQAPTESSPAPIPQADGSPERRILPKPRRGNHTSSPAKLASVLTTPQLRRHDPSTPQSSATKKRKNIHRTLPKEPRSPTRLKTNDNPPLNRDCVIAYAESEDKKNKQGILRQVKSERLGVFTESDVVFAARFFVED